jgi:hypothetical protein
MRLVEAPRGMTKAEALNFLLTGEVPSFGPVDGTVASGTVTLEFDPHQRRDGNGRWVKVTRIHEHGIDPKKLATRFYVGAGFRKLNNALELGTPLHALPSRYVDIPHNGNQFHSVEIHPEDVVEHLDAAIADSPISSSLTLYRGGSASSVNAGDVVSRRGYLSTTGTKNEAYSFIGDEGDGLWIITAPMGTHALKIDEGPNTHEDEYVLPRGIQLRVTHVDTSGSHPVVHAEVINDLTAGFDEHEPRWPKGAPGGKGGEWRDDTPGVPSVSLPKVTPTKAIYRAQIPHDEVVAVSAAGTTRMRWDQSQKKFIRERKSGDGWAHQKTLNKKQAYDQLKNEDDWHAPGGLPAPSTPTAPKKSVTKKVTPDSDGPISGVDYSDPALGESAHAKEILSMLDLGYTPQQVVEMYKREDLGPGMAELLVHEVVKFKEMQSKKDTQTGTKASKIEDVPSSQTPEQPSPVVPPASTTHVEPLGATPTTSWPFSYAVAADVQADYGDLARSSNSEYESSDLYHHIVLPVSSLIPTQSEDDNALGEDAEMHGMTGDPFVIDKDGNLYLIDGHHRAQDAGPHGYITAWVRQAPSTSSTSNDELSVDSADLPTGAQDTLISPTTEADFDYRITTAKSGKAALAAAPYNADTEDSMINEDKDSGLGYTYESPVEDFHGSGLTGMQVREAVGDYSDNGYETVNPALRESGGDPAQFPEHMKALGYSPKRARDTTAGVDAAMAASPLSDDVVVERGIVDPSAIFGSGWEDVDLTDRDWTDQGYVSTTAGTALAKFSGNGAGIQMRILVPAGTHAIGVEAATAGLSGEQELLLDRGLSFRVVHDHGMVDGRRKIDVEVVPTPKTKANAPEIAVDTLDNATPSVAHEPSAESVPPPTYEGPSFEMPSSIPQAKLDRLRELRLKSQRAAAHIEGAPALTTEEEYELYDIHSSVMHQSSPAAARIMQEIDVDVALEKFMQNHDLKPEDVAAYREELARRTREIFKDKKIAVRVTPGEIDKILSDGRFKTQFESGKSKGLKNTGLRAAVEEQWFGLPEDYDPKKRPIYGYVMVDGVRPAGLGASDMFDVSTDALSQYGQIQVVLKDDVRRRTTAMFGDSLNNKNDGIPSPVDDPSWQSYSPAPSKSMLTRGLTSEDRSVDDHEFRAGTYAEAQIHGGVTLDDIDEIIFPTTPSAAVRKKLDDSGVKWRVLNFKTAADSSPDERARALRIAEQDLAMIDEDIAATEVQIEKFKTKDKPTADEYRDDLKKLLKQRKKLTDALPGLRGKK